MATFNGRQPSAKVQGTQGPKDVQAYLKQLEDLLKRNTGSGTFIGADTSSNTPMYLPGKVANPTGLSETPSTQLSGDGMTQSPAPVQRDAPQEYQEPVQAPQSGQTVQDFFTQIAQQQTQPQTPNAQDLEQNFVTYGIDYGVASLPNNQVQMRSGAIKDGLSQPVPVASMADGSVGWSDGYARTANQFAMEYLRGVSGLSKALFGQQQTVTQPYGNVNPIEPTPGNINYGTDFRTRDFSKPLSNIMGVPLKVIQILRDDGTQYGDISGHQGYGNSVMVQLPSGETLRLSHLSSMGNYQVGDTINPGDVIGVPGQTGNTKGEHLDVEYRNSQGVMTNPEKFSLALSNANQPGEAIGYDQNMNASTFSSQPQHNQSVSRPASQIQTPMQPSPQLQAVRGIVNRVGKITDQAAQSTATGINTLNPTGKNGFGITELLQRNPEGARAEQAATLSNIGTALNAPDLNTKALSSEQGTNPIRQLAGNLVDYASTPLKKFGLPDTGFSEAIAGGKTLNTDVNLAPQANASDGLPFSRQKTPQDYSSVLGQNIKDVGNSLNKGVAQAGQGLQDLKSTGANILGNVFKPKQDVAKRAVGDIPGTGVQAPGQFSSPMDSAPSMQSLGKNDIRDPFFKSGAVNDFKSFLKPGAIDNSGGALSLDLFNESFFQDPNNISKVFGGTYMAPQAQEKYNNYRAEQERLSSQPQVTLEDYLRRGKTAAQYYAETGQQSTADTIQKYGGSLEGNSSPGNANYSAASGQSVYIPPQQSSSQPKQNTRPVASGPKQNYTPSNANYSSASGVASYIAPPRQSAPAQSAGQQSKPSTNVFSKVSSAIKKVFGK